MVPGRKNDPYHPDGPTGRQHRSPGPAARGTRLQHKRASGHRREQAGRRRRHRRRSGGARDARRQHAADQQQRHHHQLDPAKGELRSANELRADLLLGFEPAGRRGQRRIALPYVCGVGRCGTFQARRIVSRDRWAQHDPAHRHRTVQAVGPGQFDPRALSGRCARRQRAARRACDRRGGELVRGGRASGRRQAPRARDHGVAADRADARSADGFGIRLQGFRNRRLVRTGCAGEDTERDGSAAHRLVPRSAAFAAGQDEAYCAGALCKSEVRRGLRRLPRASVRAVHESDPRTEHQDGIARLSMLEQGVLERLGGLEEEHQHRAALGCGRCVAASLGPDDKIARCAFAFGIDQRAFEHECLLEILVHMRGDSGTGLELGQNGQHVGGRVVIDHLHLVSRRHLDPRHQLGVDEA